MSSVLGLQEPVVSRSLFNPCRPFVTRHLPSDGGTALSFSDWGDLANFSLPCAKAVAYLLSSLLFPILCTPSDFTPLLRLEDQKHHSWPYNLIFLFPIAFSNNPSPENSRNRGQLNHQKGNPWSRDRSQQELWRSKADQMLTPGV